MFHYQPYELALSSKLVDMVKLHGIEILHVHYAIPHDYAAYMAQKMLREDSIYVPIVTTLHGTDITLVGSHPFYKSAVSLCLRVYIELEELVLASLVYRMEKYEIEKG